MVTKTSKKDVEPKNQKTDTEKKEPKTEKKEPKNKKKDDIIPKKSLEPLQKLNEEIQEKSTLEKKDILKIKIILESVSDQLKLACDKLKDQNLSNISVEYSEKDKQCIVQSTRTLADIVKAVEMKKLKDDQTRQLRDEFLNDVGQGNRQLLVLSGNMESPFHNNAQSYNYPSFNPQQSPFLYQYGGQFLGNANGCPNNSRLVYDSQGIIGCNNPVNQGGQNFLYPKKITACVAGGRKQKKSVKKNKKSTGGSQFCQPPPPTGSCPNPDLSYNGKQFCSPPWGNDGPGCTDYNAMQHPPISHPFGSPPDMNNRLPGGVVRN